MRFYFEPKDLGETFKDLILNDAIRSEKDIWQPGINEYRRDNIMNESVVNKVPSFDKIILNVDCIVRNFFKSDKNKYCSMNKKQPRSAT
jgi:hypothetical protein